jgi:hypothetical protein
MNTLAKWAYATFAGRRNTYAVQKAKELEIEYTRVSGKQLTHLDYLNHLNGTQVLGIYPALENNTTCFAAIDIDDPKFEIAKEVSLLLPQPNYIERSRTGNHHVWMFFRDPILIDDLAIACQTGLDLARKRVSDHCGLYPLPLRLAQDGRYQDSVGVCIALPLQGQLLAANKTVFYTNDEQPIDIHSLPDHIQFIPTTGFYEFLQNTKSITRSVDSDILKDPFIYRLWIGIGKTTGDLSASGYDFSFAKALAVKGFLYEEIYQHLRKRPNVHKLDEAYLEKTVKQAQEAAVTYTTETKHKNTAARERDEKQTKKRKTKGKSEHSDNFHRTEREEPVVKSIYDDLRPITRADFYEATKCEYIFEKPQIQQLDVFFGTIIANLKMSGRPVWLLMIGPPGSGKTLPMTAVQNSPHVYTVSSFKPTALISGWGLKGSEDMSLIPKLDGKILMVKDMSSVLSQNREVVAEILGLLRDAYDGSCGKAYGTGVEKLYESSFGFIGATTPDIDSNWSLNVRLGERFIRYRIKSTLDHVYHKIDKALETLFEEPKAEGVLEEAALSLMKHLMREGGQVPKLSMPKQIGRLAQLGAILRTGVSRNSFNNHILVIPEWEEATRYAKQLAKMAVSLAYIRDKPANDEEEFEDLRAIVRDSLDARVERICQAIISYPNSDSTAIAQRIGLPDWTVRQILQDLEISRILLGSKNGLIIEWDFVPWLKGQIEQFKLWVPQERTSTV